jgi:chemotaxis protein MotB
MMRRIEPESVEVLLSKTTKWAMAYGDLMSSLMILFLLLFSFSVIGGVEGKERVDQFQQAFGGTQDSYLANSIKQMTMEENVAQEIKGFIESNSLQGYAVVKVDDYQIKIMLTQAVMFGVGASVLQKASHPILNKLAEMLKKIDNNIVIEGHTDDVPFHGGSNMELSAKRAQSVLAYLVKIESLSPERVSISGYGEFRPLVPNSSDENREKNRRVEINIIRKHQEWSGE